jgi:hypothetical protein
MVTVHLSISNYMCVVVRYTLVCKSRAAVVFIPYLGPPVTIVRKVIE